MVKCYKKGIGANEIGKNEVMRLYGKYLFIGRGIEDNEEEGMLYIRMAMDKGNADAIYYYGRCLFLGDSIPADRKEGLRLMKIAADKGIID